MYKYLLESAGDINWMAVFPLIVFIAFFSIVILVTFLRKKEHISHLAQLPFDHDSQIKNPNEDAFNK